MSTLRISIVAGLAAALTLALAACGGGDPAPPPAPTTPPAPTATTPPAASDTTTTGDAMTTPKQWNSPPALSIDPGKQYQAVITTDLGAITLNLFASETPNTVNNFVFLAREGFYDGVIFHRTIPGFMIQGGDPTGTGTGGPGYRFADEPVRRQYIPGTLAMANAGPDTNGSQFFIMHGAVSLPPNYTIFGLAASGVEVVDAIATAPTQPGGEGSRPVTPVKIVSVEIIEEG